MAEFAGSWATRIGGATEKERADKESLENLFGCKVYTFGQSLLPNEARAYLQSHHALLYLRWLADMLVVRPDLYKTDAEEWMWLVDSKSGRQDTPNWILEKSAHTAHRLQRTALGLPIVYIWPDGCTCSYIEDLPDEVLIDGPMSRHGSGTPYWLVPKRLARPLEDVFGQGVAA